MTQSEGPSLLLIAGVPATGKSTFCSWLAANKGYSHVDADKVFPNPVRLRSLGLEGCSTGGALVTALRRLGSRVALDWGFPPECLPFVQQCKDAGMELWWFDGDPSRAREEFARRNRRALPDFDVQMPKILRNQNALLATFSPNIINALPSEGLRMESEAIWTRVSGGGPQSPGVDRGMGT